MKQNSLACGLCLVLLAAVAQAEDVAPTYSIKEGVIDSGIPRKIVKNIPVPPDKPYAQLTADEKQKVKSLYQPPLGEEDEPPYPEHGLRQILDPVHEVENVLLVDGALFVAVHVDASGKATGVRVYRSPDKKLTGAVADILLLTKYKPAVCHGIPCKMDFPFHINFTTSR